mmetsp:Transcript_32051/g.98961  ORF Transcript_32051/g.98961 Transcript_32051/m.98961 type:complete len:200 (+) Transcript_32051:2586-3185(+)
MRRAWRGGRASAGARAAQSGRMRVRSCDGDRDSGRTCGRVRRPAARCLGPGAVDRRRGADALSIPRARGEPRARRRRDRAAGARGVAIQVQDRHRRRRARRRLRRPPPRGTAHIGLPAPQTGQARRPHGVDGALRAVAGEGGGAATGALGGASKSRPGAPLGRRVQDALLGRRSGRSRRGPRRRRESERLGQYVRCFVV